MAPSSSSSMFKVRRHEPELIRPAKPTPYELKPLSDIDDQESLRFQVPAILIYGSNPFMQGKDPIQIIKQAIAKALVFYYPLAGRLKEGPHRKLIVECTSEGVLFVGADAEASLEEVGDDVRPPCPCFDQLLYDVPGSNGILNCPLVHFQVTRFTCGGLIVAFRMNHTMSDGPGMGQLLLCIGEMARGKQSPSILPVWERHLLNARNPPYVTFTHLEYEDNTNDKDSAKLSFPLDDTVDGAFFISSSKLSNLRRLIPPHLHHCSSFELLSACLWKCRTIALQPHPNQNMRMIFPYNARQLNPPLLPQGYYGNGLMFFTAMATAKEIIENPISYGVELIRKAKTEMGVEYVKSVADLMVIKGRPSFVKNGTFLVSDNRYSRFEEFDFGWGKPIYGGSPKSVPIMASFCFPFENKQGEKGIVFPICLPAKAMKQFAKEFNNLLNDDTVSGVVGSCKIKSAL